MNYKMMGRFIAQILTIEANIPAQFQEAIRAAFPVYSVRKETPAPKLVGQLALVGGMILLFGGISLCRGKRFHAANLIPALFIPIIYTAAMDKVESAVEDALEKGKK